MKSRAKVEGGELVRTRKPAGELVQHQAAGGGELARVNVVGREVSALVADLPRGTYRTHVTVCRIEFDQNGNEKSNRLVSSHSFDFDSLPKALPPAPAAKDDTQPRCRELGPVGGNRCRLVADHTGPHESAASSEVTS